MNMEKACFKMGFIFAVLVAATCSGVKGRRIGDEGQCSSASECTSIIQGCDGHGGVLECINGTCSCGIPHPAGVEGRTEADEEVIRCSSLSDCIPLRPSCDQNEGVVGCIDGICVCI
ncbi:hypothetical protein O6P43_021997 [Quillaja saponaria]|uniref:Uncharacterized protein n=1 Tax=Quillaja saponaria TaxID=32244 RepID=A0AAD7LC48_QUISA|nr:hypothetical protein O6P43_021997 [Quillaja saponaria]